MRNTDYFKGKKVAVIGLARSGAAAANLLFELGAEVRVTDNQDNAATKAAVERLKSKDIKRELGGHTREFIIDSEMLVVSPGVADTALPLAWAKETNIPLISEIELGWMLCPAPIIAVTGSTGKTTVTTLIAMVLREAGKNALACGNIGNPFCAVVAGAKSDDLICLEVSSFQLEKIRDFKPKAALILNLNRNHLDRHKDMQEYLDAKKRVFMNQDEGDYLVLNYDDPALKPLAREAKAKTIFFQQRDGLNPNQAAVCAVADIFGVKQEACLKAFRGFKGLEHRLEYVAEIEGVKFINDSKATLVESAVWAIDNISSGIILIAGGRDKGLDYQGLIPAARGKVKEVVLIGEARKKIAGAFAGALPYQEAATLEAAVEAAFKAASPGDTVLLSPMCSSFDMFSDYEERGRVFKQAVNDLKRTTHNA